MTPETKEYSFSAGEKRTLDSQNGLRLQYEYIASLIHRDMYVLVNGVIRKRLSIPDNMTITYDLEKGKLYATPKPEEKTEKK